MSFSLLKIREIDDRFLIEALLDTPFIQTQALSNKFIEHGYGTESAFKLMAPLLKLVNRARGITQGPPNGSDLVHGKRMLVVSMQGLEKVQIVRLLVMNELLDAFDFDPGFDGRGGEGPYSVPQVFNAASVDRMCID
jgi:hypothetical protein